jgi:CxxC motif-containing protein
MMNREIICISCPMGCHLQVSGDVENLEITGNKCRRGVIYAREEISAPKRVVTATVAVTGVEGLSRVPVKTTDALPKAHVASLLNHLYTLRLSSPIKIGEIILSDFHETGVGVVTTRSV